jgi:uncharacterized HAD superfamily protein
MCLSCGCQSPSDGHQDPRNVTLATITAAADAMGLTVLQAAHNVAATFPVPGPLPALYCDIDGVLAFEPEGSIIAVNAMFATSYLAAEVDWFPFSGKLSAVRAKWLAENWPQIAANLAPDTIAADVMRRAVAHGYPLTVCTERGPSLAAVTSAWLNTWEIPADKLAVVEPGGKATLLAGHSEDNPAILIDNSPLNVSIARPGVSVWQPARPYNSGGDGVIRFTDWNEAAALLGLVV